MRSAVAALPFVVLPIAALSPSAVAQTAASSPPTDLTPSQINLSSDTTPAPTTTIPEAPPEAPPPLPRHKGFVTEGSLGAMAFLGQFRHVAPTAPWFHALFGYEFLPWFMLLAQGELGFTDTSVAEDATHSFAFPIFAFGGGARLTAHVTPRVAGFVQASIDAMKADVPRGALRVLGYRDAEGLSPAFGGRVGVEWYQMDRHLALGLSAGVRDATGFANVLKGDTGLMADGAGEIRYTF